MNEVLNRIKRSYESFTANQQDIAKFLLKQPEQIEKLNVRELAKVTRSAPSAIINFSKRLGYKGYSEMKYEFLNNREDLSSFMIPYMAVNKIKQTSAFKQVADKLYQAEKIYLLAYQMSQIPAKDFYFKMHKIAPSKIVFFTSFEDQIRNLPIIKDGDVVLMISNSGECEEILSATPLLPSECCKILLTNGVKSNLSKHVDIELSLGILEDDPLLFKEIPTLSRNALLYALDELFKTILEQDYENNLKKIRQSSKFFLNKR